MIEPGMVVQSAAGHDAGTFYLVLAVENRRLFLADGRRRKMGNPKCKSVRHIRKTNTRLQRPETDKKLREALRAFHTDQGGE